MPPIEQWPHLKHTDLFAPEGQVFSQNFRVALWLGHPLLVVLWSSAAPFFADQGAENTVPQSAGAKEMRKRGMIFDLEEKRTGG